jgi:hypothetical protein
LRMAARQAGAIGDIAVSIFIKVHNHLSHEIFLLFIIHIAAVSNHLDDDQRFGM